MTALQAAGRRATPVRIELARPSRQSWFTTTEPGVCLRSGASCTAPEPSTTIRALPVTSAARVTAVCSSGRPATRTSCFAEPKRSEGPAASTTAYSPSPDRPAALPLSAGVTFSACRKSRGAEADAGGQPLAHARVQLALLEDRIGVDGGHGAPVTDTRIGG